jgi:hypothetical protein
MHVNFKMIHRHRMRTPFQRLIVNKMTIRTENQTENDSLQESGLSQDCESSQIGKHNPRDFKESYILPRAN